MTTEEQQIIERIENSRQHIEHGVAGVAASLDVPSRIVASVRSQPWLWASGAGVLLLGTIALVLLPRRFSKTPAVPIAPTLPSPKRSPLTLAWSVAQSVFPIVRPLILTYVSKLVADRTHRAKG